MENETTPSPPGPDATPDATHTHKVPGTLAVPRSTVVLMVVTLFVVLGGLTWLLLDARARVADAREAVVTSEEVVREVRDQSERNGMLLEQGIRCLRANQQVIVANQAIPIGPDRLPLGDESCVRFLRTADGGG